MRAHVSAAMLVWRRVRTVCQEVLLLVVVVAAFLWQGVYGGAWAYFVWPQRYEWPSIAAAAVCVGSVACAGWALLIFLAAGMGSGSRAGRLARVALRRLPGWMVYLNPVAVSGPLSLMVAALVDGASPARIFSTVPRGWLVAAVCLWGALAAARGEWKLWQSRRRLRGRGGEQTLGWVSAAIGTPLGDEERARLESDRALFQQHFPDEDWDRFDDAHEMNMYAADLAGRKIEENSDKMLQAVDQLVAQRDQALKRAERRKPGRKRSVTPEQVRAEYHRQRACGRPDGKQRPPSQESVASALSVSTDVITALRASDELEWPPE